MITQQSLQSPIKPTWCPGCGNFGIWAALKNALVQLGLPEEDVVLVYGVGCSGNMTDFIRAYGFHSLHGRGIPNAIGIKLGNHKLKVIVIAGDGDTYGEAPNHLISASRGNHDITMLVHNNQIYGLTTGQVSPTSLKGMEGKSTPKGVIENPINPLALVLSSNATFAARGFSGNIPHLTELIKKAILHEGFSLVDVFQPCVTWNKLNTHQWFQQRVYDLQKTDHDMNDHKQALLKAFETEKLPIGIFYKREDLPAYHKQIERLKEGTLIEQRNNEHNIRPILEEFV